MLLWPTGFGSQIIYQLNQTTKDEVLRDLFQDVRFRRAMSLALDREEINEVLFFGLGKPRQWTLISASVLYEPRFAEAYAEFDPDTANKLLDEMGLEWDSRRRFRLRPDGKKLAWTLEILPTGPNMSSVTAMSELAKEYWAKIGLDITVKAISSELMGQRSPANEMDMNAWTGDRGTDLAFFTGDIRWFVPQSIGWEMAYGVEWGRWYITKGEQGEKPPEKVRVIYDWKEEMTSSIDEKVRNAAGKKILASQAENVWVIGTVGEIPQAVMVKNNLRNVQKTHTFTWDFLYTAHTRPEQYFFKQ